MDKWVVTHIGRSTVQECVEDRTAYANEAIIHAVHNLMAHLEAFHDSEVDSREAGNLRRIMNHLQGTLIGMEETAALRAQTAPQEAEPVAWLADEDKNDPSATTYDADVAERWLNKGWKVTPLYVHPAPQVKAVPWKVWDKLCHLFAETLAHVDEGIIYDESREAFFALKNEALSALSVEAQR